MAKYNALSTCQFPQPPKDGASDAISIVNFVYEPKPINYEEFEAENHFIFFLVLSGSCQFHTDYESFSLEKGDCCFSFPNKRYKFDGINRLKLLYITFVNPESLTILNSLGISYSNPVRTGLKGKIPYFLKEFDRSLTLKSPYLIPKYLLMMAFSYFSERQEDSQESARDKDSLIRKILNHIDLHYKEKITLQEICAQYHFSYNYISQAFKSCTGVNFSAHIQNIRIRHAKNLLTSTKKPITEIALEVGYENSHYFAAVFKEVCGITPRAYRQRFQNENQPQS